MMIVIKRAGQSFISIKYSLIKIVISIIPIALSGQIIAHLYATSTSPRDKVISDKVKIQTTKASTAHTANLEPNFLHKSDFWSLYHGEVPQNVREDNLSKIKRVSLVISHCDKPLGWITNFTEGFHLDKVWVFTKCGHEILDAPQGSNIIELPNVGRCDHTYAHWMKNYFPLELNFSVTEDEGIIVFMKDNDHQRDKGMWGNRTFRELLGLAATNGFGCMVPSHAMHKRLPPNTSVFFQYDILRTFYFVDDAHVRESRDTVKGFKDTRYRNIGEWIDGLNLSPIAVTQNLVPVCIGGVFAVTSNQINRQPKVAWESIEKSLSRGDNIQEGHFAERIWAALLSKPLDAKSATAIWKRKPQFHCRKQGASRLWPVCGTLSLPE
jgi:hypothetical protein